MAAPRLDITPDKQAIKASDRALIRAAGGVEAAALSCRVGKSLLSEYGRPDNECFMPGDVRADLEAITHGTPEHPIATRHAARSLGFALVRLPQGEPIDGATLHRALIDSMREAHELHHALAEALEDGRLDPVEAEKMERLALDAAEADMRVATLAAQIKETR